MEYTILLVEDEVAFHTLKMKEEYKDKTKEQLINDLVGLRQRIAELEKVEAERKQAEEALRESEERFRAIFEDAEDAIFTKSQKGNYTLVNPACASLFKLPPEEMIGKTDFDLFPPEVAHHIKEEIDRKVLENGEVVSVEDTKPTAGVMRTFHVVKVPLRDANGAIVGLCGIARDITKRKRLEEEKRKAQAEMAVVLDGMIDIVGISSMDGRITQINEGVELWGYKKEELIGKSVAEFIAKRSLPKLMEERERTLEEAVIKNLELIGLKSDGSEFPVLVNVTLMKDTEGKTTGRIFAVRDITERKQAEEERNKLLKAIETTKEAINITTPDTVMIYTNNAMDELFGYKKGELIGKHVSILNAGPAQEAKEVPKPIVDTIKKKGLWEGELHNKRKDGSEFPSLAKITALTDKNGKTINYVSTQHDITERKRAVEERKRILKELKAKNTELERFTYTVSHDLRSPLVTVQGFVELLRKDLERNEKEKVESDLKYIENGTAKMEHLLNDTLRLSRIGRMVNPPEDVPFGEIVQEALEQTTEQIKSSGVEIPVVENFPTVHVDRTRIVEVLVNLVTNSINYMGEQPRPKIDIEYRTDDGEPVFFVRDNGIGIDKSQHEKVFELFYTVDKSGKGTGAGLAIVKRIIEVHEGHIWIESEKGNGCTVCFTLPVA